MKGYFVTAIHTDSGKSIASAILTEALEADYWKPVQAGADTDTELVKRLVSNNKTTFHTEAYLLKTPESPHAAAAKEGINIALNDISIPPSPNPYLIVEGAGGVMAPLHRDLVISDLIAHLGLEVIMISNIYLGSINHTLLSIEHLQRKNITIKGIIFNGASNPDTEQYILDHTGLPLLFHIPRASTVDRFFISSQAEKLKKTWIR